MTRTTESPARKTAQSPSSNTTGDYRNRSLGSMSLPRAIHPLAWWIWALAMATAASRTTNPWVLLMIVAVVACVVMARRGDAPWAWSFRAYVVAGGVIIAVRVVFYILLGADTGAHVLVRLPVITMPSWMVGVEIGGPVSAEGLLSVIYDGMRLATLVICMGAANSLANPKRLLRSVPAAVYEVGTAAVVALSVAPQLVASARRVNTARQLRGTPATWRHAARSLIIPILEDSMEHALGLAAAMDSRGYGRTGTASQRRREVTGVLVIGGLIGVCVGSYGLLDSTAPRLIGLPVLILGFTMAALGMFIGSAHVKPTAYRPDRWLLAEWIVVLSAIACAATIFLTSAIDPGNLYPSLSPLMIPPAPVAAMIGVMLGLIPAFATPPPVRRASR